MSVPTFTVYVKCNLGKRLLDQRPYTFEFDFGTIKNICQQYGIKYEQLPTCIAFTAPKTRIQLFLEKLHFSRIPYSYNPL